MIGETKTAAPVTLAEMIKELDLELSYRARVYPRQWQSGRVDRLALERRIEVLRAARDWLDAELQGDLFRQKGLNR